MKLTDIKGVGEKTAENFNKLDIFEPVDLVNYFPRDMMNLKNLNPLKSLIV